MQEKAGTQRWVPAFSFSSCGRLPASSARCWRLPPGSSGTDVYKRQIQGNRIRVVLRNPHDGPFSRKGVELHPVEPRLEDAYIDAVGGMDPVSYTHLDVYKRQLPGRGRRSAS